MALIDHKCFPRATTRCPSTHHSCLHFSRHWRCKNGRKFCSSNINSVETKLPPISAATNSCRRKRADSRRWCHGPLLHLRNLRPICSCTSGRHDCRCKVDFVGEKLLPVFATTKVKLLRQNARSQQQTCICDCKRVVYGNKCVRLQLSSCISDSKGIPEKPRQILLMEYCKGEDDKWWCHGSPFCGIGATWQGRRPLLQLQHISLYLQPFLAFRNSNDTHGTSTRGGHTRYWISQKTHLIMLSGSLFTTKWKDRCPHSQIPKFEKFCTFTIYMMKYIERKKS